MTELESAAVAPPLAEILCVDDDPHTRGAIEAMLRRLGYAVRGAPDVVGALQSLAKARVDLVVTDLQMPMLGGMDLLELMRQEGYDAPVLMITGRGTIELAVAAIKAGATNFLTKPVTMEQLAVTVDQALAVSRLRSENAALLREVQTHRSHHEILGESMVLRRLLESVTAAASSRATVLLQGESGTGKELLARAIHEQSDRVKGPFVRINCAALPEGLIESTLFGHERGAFTGAFKRALGAFERADRGTLLLDEISEMRLDLQSKLLRVLQEREFERVGGASTIQVDVRVIATTNRDLAADAAAGRFRQDLYYRLSVFPIVVPPLRDRLDDVPLLAHRFAARAALESGKRVDGFAPDALELLRQHRWPGNVRELQHTVERAVILATEPLLQAHLFAHLRPGGQLPQHTVAGTTAAGNAATGTPVGYVVHLNDLELAHVEDQIVEHALSLAAGNRTRAAQLLGIDVRTLRRKLNSTADGEA